MTTALVGHTGFVGGNLAAQTRFDACYHSKTIDDIAGRRFDRVVVSGMPAAKWIANGDPAGDRATLDRLWNNLRQVAAGEVVIVSTVDVYPHPAGVDEDTPIDPSAQQPYGLNRLELERRASAHFPRVLSVRLPGLFGPGLKKNAVYDLLHDNETHKIPSAGEFQFYNLERLWGDVETAIGNDLALVNFATEPTSMADVARRAFGREFANDPGGAPPRYAMRSIHADKFGGRDGYLYDRDTVFSDLADFVRREREAAAS